MTRSALRQFVRNRAKSRCEYCRLHESEDAAGIFHLEHILPKKHKGLMTAENLCWSCATCNLKKGISISGEIDGILYRLFNPRLKRWHDHFEWDQALIVPRTEIAIVTVELLDLNDDDRIQLREQLLFEGRFPPPG